MIVGIGIDIVDTGRIEAIYGRFGKSFAAKFLMDTELAAQPANAIPWLAARFAAKEACAKALGTGFAGGVSPRQMEIIKGESGAPFLRLHGKALEIARLLDVRNTHISMSHERGSAVALVILEK